QPRPAPTPTPGEWARREFDRIDALALPKLGDVERYTDLVSQVIRHYLQQRFGLHAPRQTTVEFIATIRGDARLLPEEQELLRRLLEQCDLAKFARSALSREECALLLATARRFVEETSTRQCAADIRATAARNGVTSDGFCFDSRSKKE